MIEQKHVPSEPDPAFFAAALSRARAEYLEMPGLQLTQAQAARLWALDASLCDSILTALVEARFLMRTGKSFIRT